MTPYERQMLKIAKETLHHTKAMRRLVDPNYSGDEPRPEPRKKDPRALYGGG